MIYRILIFLTGLFLFSLGIVYLIMYLSLLKLGFSFGQYIIYILSNKEIYVTITGLALIVSTLYFDNKWNKFIAYRKEKRIKRNKR